LKIMYGKQQTTPCPMCTCWVDGFNGIAHHLAQKVDVAVVAAADPPRLRASLDPDGTPRHFYSAHPRMAEDVDQRGIDLFNPLWHLLDLTPQGRGDWYAALSY
jgi:predicted dithiol-disulfide oxidoreductase (DUF899 family)